MSQLFQRSVRVIVGSLLIEGLRVQFHVKKTTTKEPNTSDLTVYNLSEDHRSVLQNRGTSLLIEAGYVGSTSLLFSGESRYISHTHEGPDWVSKIECGDGERAYRWARVSESFRPGTRLADAFRKVAEATELDVRDAVATVESLLPAEQFSRGYQAHGRATEHLDALLRGRGLEWSIQDGQLQVLAEGTAKNTAVLLSPTTGLVGSPAFSSPEHGSKSGKKKAQVLKVRSLLQPSIRPGGTIRVESASIQGQFRVQSVTHSGDTHGGDWYSDVDALPVT